MIASNFHEILSRIQVDNFHFKVTWNPLDPDSCIMWVKDDTLHDDFEALGKFCQFDKRRILDFVTRYTTNPDLRLHINLKRFEQKIDQIPHSFFRDIEMLPVEMKKEAYKNLFAMDEIISEKTPIEKKRRLMAKKFHPDTFGGDNLAMSIINEAYDFLKDTDE